MVGNVSWQGLDGCASHAQSLQPSRRQNNRIVLTRIQLDSRVFRLPRISLKLRWGSGRSCAKRRREDVRLLLHLGACQFILMLGMNHQSISWFSVLLRLPGLTRLATEWANL